jgi:hypothetical protein
MQSLHDLDEQCFEFAILSNGAERSYGGSMQSGGTTKL